MKTIKILLIHTLIISALNTATAQSIDRERAAALEVKFDKFNLELAKSVAALEQAADLSELKAIAGNIELSSGNLLDEVKAVYPVDESYWLDAALDNAIANDIEAYAPHTANVLRTRAVITTIEGIENEKAARPSYFERVYKIYKHCKGIGRSVMLKTGRSYSEKISAEYKGIKAL
jgi:hypothetical protein